MKLYHVTNNKSAALNNNLSIAHSGTAKNGDQQAAGIHLSASQDFVLDNYYGFGCALLECTLTNPNIQKYDGEADISTYTDILIDHIGEDFIQDLIDDIDESIKDDAPLSINIDIEEEIYRSLIIYNDRFIEDLNEYFDINENIKTRLDHLLSHSFELDINEITNDNCYRMLSSVLKCRIKASESLVDKGIDGFSYKSNYNNHEVDNLCLLNTGKIKNINILKSYQEQKIKRAI